MGVEELAEKYHREIKIEDMDTVPWDDAKHDVAQLTLLIPRTMLEEYKIVTKEEDVNSENFWKNTGLYEILDRLEIIKSHQRLVDIKPYLSGKVDIHLYGQDKCNTFRLTIIEYPKEFHEDY